MDTCKHDELPKTAKAAKASGSRFYFTGRPCKRGHIEKRQTSDSACISCKSEQSRANSQYFKGYYQENKSVIKSRSSDRHESLKNDPGYERERYAASKDSQKAYRSSNRDTRNANTKKSYAENREERQQYAKDYRLKNSASLSAKFKKRYRKNKQYYYAAVAKRRSAKLDRTPPWLTEAHLLDIELAYKERDRMQSLTGVAHHVDHIVPLQGETVSGLHVPWNLQVIPAKENLSKSNAFSYGGA